jgi:FlaA1/EpsC-like NDP-sugar epimerase
VARSGNIIGSNGSVFQIWNQLIKDRKPIKITDPEMMRYFIPVEHAVSEAWRGFLAGKKLNIIKGDERKLSDFLGDILVANGYDFDWKKYPHGTEIIGKRPTEKIREKLLWDTEVEG